jgi:hypothetical protein
MKKVILMLTIACFAIAGVSAQTNRPAKPRKEAATSKEAPATSDAPSTKNVATEKIAPAPTKYEMVAEDDSYRIYVYYVSKNAPKYLAISKSDCSIMEAIPKVSGESSNQRKSGSDGQACYMVSGKWVGLGCN